MALDSILLKQSTISEAIRAGAIKVEGDRGKLDELMGMLDEFALDFPVDLVAQSMGGVLAVRAVLEARTRSTPRSHGDVGRDRREPFRRRRLA